MDSTYAREDVSTISQCRQKGFAFISQALGCEETETDVDLAPILYNLGIKELEHGLGLCGGRDRDPVLFQLRREMLVSLSRAKDRLEFLLQANGNVENESRQNSKNSWTGGVVRDIGRNSVRSRVQSFEISSSGNRSTGKSVERHHSEHTPHRKHGSDQSVESPNTFGHFSRPTLASILKSKEEVTPSPTRTINSSSLGCNNVRKTVRTESPKPKPPETATRGTNETSLSAFLSSTIVSSKLGVTFSQVIGHIKAKEALQEMVILPTLRPELFAGLRSPAKGLLLFGPPGNGKTLLAKALACESNSTLFNITAASLTSKFVGEGEKLVRELFVLARAKAPSIIFIDEIDSILCSRKESDHEASRRLKTEFFSSFDGLLSSSQERLIVVGATNRPQELDDAGLRRFSKRIYVGLPDFETRQELLSKLLSEHSNPLTSKEIIQISKATVGYSCSDITSLAREAALGPLRELGPERLKTVTASQIRPIQLEDFRSALPKVRTSVNNQLLASLDEWNRKYGDVS